MLKASALSSVQLHWVILIDYIVADTTEDIFATSSFTLY